MSTQQIIEEIERRAETREFGRFQEIRSEVKGSALRYRGIFHPQTTFETYAFHYGGRKELQFNIGTETDNRYRHGVAFSFEPSRTLPEPESLLPSVQRFNAFLRECDACSDLLMWYWIKNDNRSADYQPTPIQPSLIQRGRFVFMGRMQPSKAIDYDLVLDDFERLLPLYRFVEGKAASPQTAPKERKFEFKSGCSTKPSGTTATRAEMALDVRLRQNQIQTALHKHLVDFYGSNEVGTENYNAGGSVDVVVRRGDRFWFYEIKTSTSARACIREALSQLLEYSYWPGAQIADRLIIVGEPALDDQSKYYLNSLRDHFSIPIEYRQFDLRLGKFVGQEMGGLHAK
jgi:hypothetical protein